MKYMANVGTGILLRKILSTNLSGCWSQSNRNMCEWEIHWGLVKAKENQASEPSALSRPGVNAKSSQGHLKKT